jgi:hypothetical protein
MNAALDKSKDDMTNNPTEHQDYAKEWAAFYKAKVAELRRKGKLSERYMQCNSDYHITRFIKELLC